MDYLYTVFVLSPCRPPGPRSPVYEDEDDRHGQRDRATAHQSEWVVTSSPRLKRELLARAARCHCHD
ncbi:hypothetical protein AGIG_G21112 [Arapaima gigas]